ncbi:sphingomyelin synthase-related protein 1-like [Glandiceps talaboti]
MLPGLGDNQTPSVITTKNCHSGMHSIRKTILSLFAFVLVMSTTAWVAVIVNDRNPLTSDHPPLPDFILDNLTPIAQANYVSALALYILTATIIMTLVLHRYRLVLMQRYISSIIMLYVWRNLTMLVTSLPSTQDVFTCAAKTDGTLQMRIQQALVEFLTLGSTTDTGVICGDYIYSGHTISFIFMIYFILRYTQNIGGLVHPLCCITTVAGIISLLVSFSHYTVDIVISIILAPLCLTLHEVLVENPPLRQKYKLARLMFPLMGFLEADRDDYDTCIVHNQYDWEALQSWARNKLKM